MPRLFNSLADTFAFALQAERKLDSRLRHRARDIKHISLHKAYFVAIDFRAGDQNGQRIRPWRKRCCALSSLLLFSCEVLHDERMSEH